MDTLSCEGRTTRELNRLLRQAPTGTGIVVEDPGGRHNLAVGVPGAVEVRVRGDAGYFLGGLSGSPLGGPSLTVEGSVGWSVGENLMGGTIRVTGNASQSAAASARGGSVVIEGGASLRAGISLKGATLAIAGDAGAMAGFMAQAGTILIGGDAGPALGDSLYEAVIYVGGRISSLGADARREELTDEDVLAVKHLVSQTGFDHVEPGDVARVASARSLYHFSSHARGLL